MRLSFRRRAYAGPLSDAEVLTDFADEPVLLALADAIFVTQRDSAIALSSLPRSGSRGNVRRSTPRVGGSGVAVGAATLAALALLAFALWPRTEGGLLDEALAAIGQRPVIQVVTSELSPEFETIDIRSGSVRQLARRTEVLFDPERRVLRTRVLLDGQLVMETRETPAGGTTSHGTIVTCDWIARHSSEAARLGLSCPETGARALAWTGLDPALAGFLDSYQDALRTGTARYVGQGSVDGRTVDWLTFSTRGGTSERVALDQGTRKPLVVQQGDRSITVESIETVARSPELKSQPRPLLQLEISSVVASQSIAHDSVREIIQDPYQLDEAVVDLVLLKTERQVVETSDGEITTALALSYGAQSTSRARLKILQAEQPLFAHGWGALQGLRPQPSTALRVVPFGLFARLGNTYIMIHGTQGGLLPLARSRELLRALEPMPSTP